MTAEDRNHQDQPKAKHEDVSFMFLPAEKVSCFH